VVSIVDSWLGAGARIAATWTRMQQALESPRCRHFWRLLAIVVCGLHAWLTRHYMNPDGVSYLDLADAWRNGPWSQAVNGHWSPLYSWLIAGTLGLLRPAPRYEFAAVHGLNFAIFLLALTAFEWLLHEAVLCQRQQRRAAGGTTGFLPEWALTGLAYCFFIWITLRLIKVSLVTPDMCVALAVYLAAALLLRLHRQGPRPLASALLGLVLALGYLAKGVMFPLAFVFLTAAALAAGSLRQALRALLPAALVFTVVAGSFVAVLSASKGRLTFSDSGKLNYLWWVEKVPGDHFLGDNSGRRPLNTPRVLLVTPPVFEFARAGMGTYPLHFDPSYWYEGVPVRVSLTKQFSAIRTALLEYVNVLGLYVMPCTLAMLVLYAVARSKRRVRLAEFFSGFWGLLTRQYPLLLPALACLGVYGAVGIVEERYVGPFLPLLFLALLLDLQAAPARMESLRRWSAAVLLSLAVTIGADLVQDGRKCVADVLGIQPVAQADFVVVCHLQQRGVGPEAAVGFIGNSFAANWARMGRYHIVADIPPAAAATFWESTPSVQAEAVACFRQAGVRAIVAENAPPDACQWTRIPGTTYSLLLPNGAY